MIRQLDPSVYNKISAGEVVERPASVVKELVENSIDAKAKRITIEIVGGGLEQITVSDDGKGIDKEDLVKVFLPHATSKIATADDLFGISTMGFRGEAMASIAAVTMVNLTSRVEGQDAFSIQVDGGQVGEIVSASGALGTTVTVRNLFFHTPARLKFLKSTKSETRDITALVEKVMIANPHLAIRYVVDGKTVYESAGEGLEEVVHVLYDDDLTSHLIPIKGEEYGYSVEGFVSDTLFSRGTRTAQTTVVNGRVINNQQLSGAINNAYRDYLMKHCYPVLVLHITVPFDEVDVNVHPTKADVRFVYANKLFGFVYRTVKKALDEDLAKGALFFDGVEEQKPNPVEPAAHWDLGVTEQPKAKVDLSYLESISAASSAVHEDNDLLSNFFSKPAEPKPIVIEKPQQPVKVQTQTMEDLLGLDKEETAKDTFAPIKVLGQLLGTYLIAEYRGEMLVIDQHAAAERVLFDRLVEEYCNGQVVVQPLLLPYDFTLNSMESELLDSRLEALASIGVEINKTGEEEYSLTALPAMLTNMDVDEFVKRVLALDPTTSLDIFKERLAYAACHSALRGNTYMDEEGIKLIVNGLFGGRIPRQCPHGRPAYVKISRSDLDKMFKRIV